MLDDFQLLESKVEYKNHWYSAGYDRMKQPNSEKKKYFWVDIDNAVTIVPILDEHIIMVKEYRPVTGETYVSCPTGVVESDEEYVQTAKRELEEETNYTSGDFTHIQSLDVATGVLRHERGIVIAENLDLTQQNENVGEKNEFIKVVKIPKDEVVKTIRESPANSASIEAILLAKKDGYL